MGEAAINPDGAVGALPQMRPDAPMTAQDFLHARLDKIQDLFPQIVPHGQSVTEVLRDDSMRSELFTKVVDEVYRALGDDPFVRQWGSREQFSEKPLDQRLEFLGTALDLLFDAHHVHNP